MSNEARIDVVIDASKAQGGANAVKNAVDGIKGGFVQWAIAAVAVEQALVRVWQSAKAGAQFEETMGRLNRQMGGFHSTAQSMISDLQLISHGTLGVSDAATMASRALATGLDPNQVNTFTQAAMLLKDVMGTELPQAFDQMVTAAVGGRGQILRNIGIFVDMDEEIKRLAVSTGRTTGQITQQEKAMLMQAAVAGKVEAAAKKLTDGAVSGADKLHAVEIAWANMWIGIDKTTNAGVQGTLNLMDKFYNYIAAHPGKFIPGYAATKGFGMTTPTTTEFEAVSPRTYRKGGDTGEKVLPLPSSIQRAILQDAADINAKILQGEEDRFKASLQAHQTMLDADVAMQMRTAEEVVARKGDLDLQALSAHADFMSRERAAEAIVYGEKKKIAADSIQENIALEKEHKDFLVDNNQAILANDLARENQIKKNRVDGSMAAMTTQEQLGQRLVENAVSTYKIQEDMRKQDLDDLETYYQGEVDMGLAQYRSDSDMAAKERVLLREQMAFKLKLKTEEVDRILFLRTMGDTQGALDIANRSTSGMSQKALVGYVESKAADDIMKAERANNDFFAAWSRGLQKYAHGRDTVFDMSVDMARRTAQGMEQGFQKFFFDGMSGKFNSFKDVLKSVLDFTQQIVSQMAAQLVTIGLVKPAAEGLSSWLSGLGGSGPNAQGMIGANNAMLRGEATGGFGPGFASGGSFTVGGYGGTDTTPVMFRATPGERVTVATPGQQAGAAQAPVRIDIQVINQMPGAKVEEQHQTGPGGIQQIRILIRKEMNAAIADGAVDKSMTRFGATPQPIGR